MTEEKPKFETTVTFVVTATFDLSMMYRVKERADTLSDGIVRDVKKALGGIWSPDTIKGVEIDGISARSTVIKEGKKKQFQDALREYDESDITCDTD